MDPRVAKQALRIESHNAGRRADVVLRAWLRVPHAELCRWLRRGFVRRNGHKMRTHDRLVLGDVLSAPAWAQPSDADVPRVAPLTRGPPLAVVYEDDDVLIADKPAGLASHGGIGHEADSLAARLLAHCGDGGIGRRPGLAQRLDAGVSGLVPCGKHAAALRGLMGPPHGPPLHKLYVAVVAGHWPSPQAVIDAPLYSTDEPRGDAPKVIVDAVRGKPAITCVWRLASARGRSLLAVLLRTGRTHQIRAHLRSVGHPLLGDPRYGYAEDNERAKATWGTTRPLLHAARLILTHPMHPPQRVRARAPLPLALQRALPIDLDSALKEHPELRDFVWAD